MTIFNMSILMKVLSVAFLFIIILFCAKNKFAEMTGFWYLSDVRPWIIITLVSVLAVISFIMLSINDSRSVKEAYNFMVEDLRTSSEVIIHSSLTTSGQQLQVIEISSSKEISRISKVVDGLKFVVLPSNYGPVESMDIIRVYIYKGGVQENEFAVVAGNILELNINGSKRMCHVFRDLDETLLDSLQNVIDVKSD